jgi:hypothetical protein
VLAVSTPEEQRRFIGAVPLGPRLLMKAIGKRAHAAYRKDVYGSAGQTVGAKRIELSTAGV